MHSYGLTTKRTVCALCWSPCLTTAVSPLVDISGQLIFPRRHPHSCRLSEEMTGTLGANSVGKRKSRTPRDGELGLLSEDSALLFISLEKMDPIWQGQKRKIPNFPPNFSYYSSMLAASLFNAKIKCCLKKIEKWAVWALNRQLEMVFCILISVYY